MTDLTIKVVNPEDELQSFPLQQSIILETSDLLEDSLIYSNIALLREVQEYGLLNTADLYNFNIGYVKETFSTIPLDIILFKDESDRYLVKITPKETLSPSSKYALFLDKDLSYEHISIKKTVSFGPSSLTLLDSENNNLSLDTNTYVLKVISDPFITPTSNIIKFRLYINGQPDKLFTIDAKSSKKTISFSNVKVEVKDTAYGLGEEFEIIDSGTSKPLNQNFVVSIKTVLSSKIKPLENVNPSQKVSNQDILDFYTQLNTEGRPVTTTGGINFKEPSWINNEIRIEYAGYNKFLLHLNNLDTSELDLDAITYREGPAYNKFDLELLGLYSEKDKFNIITEILDDKTILFILEGEDT